MPLSAAIVGARPRMLPRLSAIPLSRCRPEAVPRCEGRCGSERAASREEPRKDLPRTERRSAQPEDVLDGVDAGGLAVEELGAIDGAAGEAVVAVGVVRDLQALAQAAEVHLVVARDVAGAQRVEAHAAGLARAVACLVPIITYYLFGFGTQRKRSKGFLMLVLH